MACGSTRAAVAALVGLFILLTLPAAAAAHTDFESSTPEDGAEIESFPDEILIQFTKPVTLVDSGFEVLLPDGTIIVPTVVSADDQTWSLAFAADDDAGEVAVRYQVTAADDGHGITGGFSFIVLTGTPSVTSEPASAPTTAPADDSVTGPSATDSTATDPTATDPPAASAETVEEFLASTDGSVPIVGYLGRALGMVAALMSVGLLSIVTWVIFDDRQAAGRLLELAAAAGLALVLAAGLESYSLAGEIGVDLQALLSSRLGLSPLLRIGAGLLLSGVGLVSGHRWARWGVAVAVGICLVSFALDGHTVSVGPQWLHSIVDVVHVGAAGVWFGGLFLMLLQLRSTGVDQRRKSELMLRFSGVAAVALAPVMVAGLVMAVLIADSPSDLFATTWGRVLLAKVVVVIVAMGLGAVNRLKLLPRMASSTSEDSLADALVFIERVLRLEVVAVVVVALLTAGLVASSTL